MNKDKPRSEKCRNFCFSFDTHNYCPTCRESGKGDDPCVSFDSPWGICAAFTEEQSIKITHRKRYVKKQKRDTTKDDELNLLGDEDVESFSGSQADLESAADNLFTSPPHPQPLPFESLLSIKTPAKSFPPTPGTALQQKIESKLETSLGNTFNIHLQQQMGVFQASMVEAFQSLRDEFSSFEKTSNQPEVEVDQTSSSASKPGPSNQVVNWTHPIRDLGLPHTQLRLWKWSMAQPFHQPQHDNASDQPSSLSDEATKVALARPKKQPHSHKKHDTEPRSASDQYSGQSDEPQVISSRPEKHADRRKHKVRSRYVSSSSEEDQSSAPRHRSSKPSGTF